MKMINLPGSSSYPGEIYEQGYQVESNPNSSPDDVDILMKTLWLDQRGTGLSTPLSPDILPANVSTDEQIAQYLKHFRADSIVKDCKAIRRVILGDQDSPEDRKWTLLGQSFGGFCAITYLSFHSKGIKEDFLTGRLAPLVDQPDLVYEALAQRVMKRNTVYYAKYPQDIERVRNILGYLGSNRVVLPNGGSLTPSRWQQLGMSFEMHELVFRASNDLELFKKLSYKTLQLIEHQQPFDGSPLYAVLTNQYIVKASRATQKYDQFSWAQTKCQADTVPVYFTGEMIFPHMFDDYSNLRPWKGAAEILAKDDSWGPLYDLDQLAKNEVKVSAVTILLGSADAAEITLGSAYTGLRLSLLSGCYKQPSSSSVIRTSRKLIDPFLLNLRTKVVEMKFFSAIVVTALAFIWKVDARPPNPVRKPVFLYRHLALSVWCLEELLGVTSAALWDGDAVLYISNIR
ncbi:Alpha/Beta hydrolase protein [Crassisporium funariophilum]|nr:Alpha/Beta hydrolase protein [Crassisporium funariophilum]